MTFREESALAVSGILVHFDDLLVFLVSWWKWAKGSAPTRPAPIWRTEKIEIVCPTGLITSSEVDADG